jgi:two-component system cell cycle sensor histidine kinase/response regulator CckA
MDLEAERRESRAREKAVLDAALDCIVTMDDRGRIVDFNPAAERTFGFSQDQVVGKLLGETIVPPSLRKRHREGLKRYLEGGDPTIIGKRLELTGMRADGTEFPLEVLVTRADVDGRPFFAGFLRDLSAQRRSEREHERLEGELRQALKMDAIGQLAGGIAHDFNNLLTVIGGESDLLLGAMSEDDPHREQLERVRTAVECASALTRQLLAFSRQQPVQPRPLDLNGAVEGIVPMLRRVIGERIELHTQLGEELGHVRADPSQIDQVILNLTVNARDAMPDGGTLTLETSVADVDDSYATGHVSVPIEPGRYAVLSVCDTGEGIDHETQARIFEPFFTTKGEAEGTGLGLSTVYGIARQNGGFIWVYSEPGHGATFKVYLPRIEGAEGAGEGPEEGEEALVGTETVLLVEDSETVRAVVRRILDSQGYGVIEAADGEEALEAYERHADEIELVLSDMVMPGMGGPEMSEELLARDSGLRLVFMSGYSETPAGELPPVPDGAGFIQKPFTPGALGSEIRRILDAA